jgi:hypothetical protein
MSRPFVYAASLILTVRDTVASGVSALDWAGRPLSESVRPQALSR